MKKMEDFYMCVYSIGCSCKKGDNLLSCSLHRLLYCLPFASSLLSSPTCVMQLFLWVDNSCNIEAQQLILCLERNLNLDVLCWENVDLKCMKMKPEEW